MRRLKRGRARRKVNADGEATITSKVDDRDVVRIEQDGASTAVFINDVKLRNVKGVIIDIIAPGQFKVQMDFMDPRVEIAHKMRGEREAVLSLQRGGIVPTERAKEITLGPITTTGIPSTLSSMQMKEIMRDIAQDAIVKQGGTTQT